VLLDRVLTDIWLSVAASVMSHAFNNTQQASRVRKAKRAKQGFAVAAGTVLSC